MKIFCIFLLLFAFQFSFCQNNDSIATVVEDKVYRVDEVDVKASFAGGIDKFREYIAKNIKRPKKGTPGKIIFSFIVESDGSINDVTIFKNDFDEEFATEAIQTLKTSPKWIPAEEDGKKVRTRYLMPVNF